VDLGAGELGDVAGGDRVLLHGGQAADDGSRQARGLRGGERADLRRGEVARDRADLRGGEGGDLRGRQTLDLRGGEGRDLSGREGGDVLGGDRIQDRRAQRAQGR